MEDDEGAKDTEAGGNDRGKYRERVRTNGVKYNIERGQG